MNSPDEVRDWFSEYATHLWVGSKALSAGEPLTQDFGVRCQELDDRIRSIGGDALRAASELEDFDHFMAEVERASAAFEAELARRMSEISGERHDNTRARKGLLGYASTGLWMKNQEGRYIDRIG